MMKTANGRVLDRLLGPVSSSLNEEAARKLVVLKADRKTQAQVAKLARKCNEGEMTPEIPLDRQRPAQYVFSRHVEEAVARLEGRGQPAQSVSGSG